MEHKKHQLGGFSLEAIKNEMNEAAAWRNDIKQIHARNASLREGVLKLRSRLSNNKMNLRDTAFMLATNIL